jgi:serine/threonine-protein kinase
MTFCPICEKTYEDGMAVCPADGATLRKAGPPPDLLLGQTIKGRYRVLRKLGQGGMGSVYLAEQVSVARKVALKVLHGDFAADEDFVKRFRLEARLAASLNHRNVITIHEFDQADDGSLFIAMEYLEGHTLNDLIRDHGALPVGRAVRLGLQIAQGLEAAHRAGVIHRDIKPHNIMVVAGDEVKLMDFGIARLQDAAGSGLTRTGVVMGTPAYMAPEQIEGGDVTERTDIYAFGIVLYEMLAGSVPFMAATPRAILTKHLQERPTPLRAIKPSVPIAVERVVMQTLEKDPAARPATMGEVINGLSATASYGAPSAFPQTEDVGGVVAELATGRQRTQMDAPAPAGAGAATAAVAEPRPARSSRKFMAITVGVVAVVLIAVGGIVYFAWPSRPVPPPAGVAPPAPPPTKPTAEATPARPPDQGPPVVKLEEQPKLPPVVQPPPRPPAERPAKPPRPTPELGAGGGGVALGDTNQIRREIEKRLRSGGLLKDDERTKKPNLTVKVEPGGVVTLVGVVLDSQQKDDTVRIVKAVAGVTKVEAMLNLAKSWSNQPE